MRKEPNNVRGAVVLAFALASTAPLTAQAHNPVTWTITSAPKAKIKPAAKFDITVTGTPEAGWHLYAMEEPEDGPNATQVGIAEGDPASLLGVSASKPETVHDPAFNLNTALYTTAARFTLHLKAADAASNAPVHVLVRYQSCSSTTCLPPHTETLEVPVQMGR